jgi:ABC-type phosphate transport system substrate-binding protein
MKTFRRPIRGRSLSVLAVLATMVAALSVTAVSSAITYRLPQNVRGSGSDVMFHMNSALDQLYNETPGCNTIIPSGTQPLDQECISDPNNPDVTTENTFHDVVSENYPIGGGAGVNQLCSQGLANVAQVDYARQTSPYSLSNCTGLHFVAFARDAVTFEVFPNLTGSALASQHNTSGLCNGKPAPCLTQAQLTGIYNCTITNWNQVGGANATINLYTVLPQYGTSKFWYSELGDTFSSTCGTAIHQTNNAEIPAAKQPNAIYPVSVGSWTERYKKKPGGSVLGSIDGVAPTAANIQGGSFPFGRFLYNVFCAGDPTKGNKCGTASPASAATVAYVGENGWLCKATAHAADPVTGTNYRTEITSTITKYGFSALPKGATGGGTAFNNYCRLTTAGS